MITLVLPLLLVSIINVCLGVFEPSTDVISPRDPYKYTVDMAKFWVWPYHYCCKLRKARI